MQEKMVFRLGSLSKTVTSLLVLRLSEQGFLHWMALLFGICPISRRAMNKMHRPFLFISS